MSLHELYTRIQEEGLRACTDTRAITSQCFFAALRGERFDGNKYAQEALDQGASFALVDSESLQDIPGCVYVRDVLQTLQELARMHRRFFDIPIIAIGGSNGKTTTRALIAEVLKKKYVVHHTQGNLNNHIGVPLTLLAMPRDTECAVIEIGANHEGEHTALLGIVEPTHVLVTNNGFDHLEGFGSPEGVRRANKEIYDWTLTRNASIFVHAKQSDLMEDSLGGLCVVYPTSSVQALPNSLYAGVVYHDLDIISKLYGSYNVENIHAAICVGETFGVPTDDVVDAIRNMEPDATRSRVVVRPDYTLVLDCYNANPSSMKASLEHMFSITDAKKIIVVGDMLELGAYASCFHEEMLEYIKKSMHSDDVVMCVGATMCEFKNQYPFYFFVDTASAKDMYDSLDKSHCIVFLKGSRGVALERLVG